MNSSLAPNPWSSQSAEPEADQLQNNTVSPNSPSSPDEPDEAGEPNESVQSFYDAQPIELSGGNSLPPRGQMLFQRGLSALRAGEIDSALEIWRQAHAEFPEHAVIAHNLGLGAAAAQQYDEAIAAFHKANQLEPSLIVSNLNSVCISMSSMAYHARIDEFLEQSQILRKQGRGEEAEKAARLLLKEFPHSSAGLAELSLILVERSHRDPQKSADFLTQALQHAQRALFLDPTLSSGFIALATAQRFLGTHREAFATSSRLLKLQPRPDSSLRLFAGEHALRASRAEKNDPQLTRIAVEYADQVIAEEPDNVRAWTLRADANALLISTGGATYDQSLADYERLLELEPKNPHALEFRDFLLAQCYQDEVIGQLSSTWKEALGYLEANDNKKAVPLLRQILKEEPDNRATLSNLSLALRRLKQWGEALSVQTHLAQLSPTPQSWRLVANIALQLKNYEHANNAYVQVAELLPHEARSHSDVATTLEALGRAKEAIPHWQRVVELAPDDENAWSHLGKNLLDAGCSQHPVDESLLYEAIPALDKAHALDGSDTNVTSQLAVGLAEIGDLERARGYASRLAGHDPVAHSTLVQSLTDIQSRRLAEGLASRSVSPTPAPSLPPFYLSAEHTGDPLMAQPFSPVTLRSKSPWFVAVAGLSVIAGIWVALQQAGYGYSKPSSDVGAFAAGNLAPPNYVQPPSSQSFPPPRPPSFRDTPPSFSPADPLLYGSIKGWWTGSVNGKPARLFVDAYSRNGIYGSIFVGNGDRNDLQVQINGTLSPTDRNPALRRYNPNLRNVYWRETQIISNPRKINWQLSTSNGTIRNIGNRLWMGGSGQDGNRRYGWSFTHDREQNTNDSKSVLELPANWGRIGNSSWGFSMGYPDEWPDYSEYLGGKETISLQDPSALAHVVIEVTNTPVTSPLKYWKSQHEQLRRQYGRDYRLVSLDTTGLGGQAGATWQFDLKRPGETQLRKIERYVTYNGRGYTLIQTAPTKDFNKWLPTFNRMTSSFAFPLPF